MGSRPKPSAKNESGEYAKFSNFMKRLVAVPHSEIKTKLDAEKQAKKRKKSRISSASRAASGAN
jgi:hypothetical protein